MVHHSALTTSRTTRSRGNFLKPAFPEGVRVSDERDRGEPGPGNWHIGCQGCKHFERPSDTLYEHIPEWATEILRRDTAPGADDRFGHGWCGLHRKCEHEYGVFPRNCHNSERCTCRLCGRPLHLDHTLSWKTGVCCYCRKASDKWGEAGWDRFTPDGAPPPLSFSERMQLFALGLIDSVIDCDEEGKYFRESS